MRRLLALAVLFLIPACEDCSGIDCSIDGLYVSAKEVRGGALEVCVGERCQAITMSAETRPWQPAPERQEFRFEMTPLGVRPASYGPPATGAMTPTIFADKEGFDVRITLKGADGAVLTTKETRAKRESGGCCGAYWIARI